MPSSWIRVDAEVGGDARISRARRILKVSKPTMVGMLVLLEIELLKQQPPSGEIANIGADTLAEWAGYDGKPDLFATALDELTDDGRIYGWEDRHGVLLTRLEKDAARKRALRNKRLGLVDAPEQSNGRPQDIPRNSSGRPQDVAAPSALYGTETERNGDGTETEHQKPVSESSNRRSGSPTTAAAPPAGAGPFELLKNLPSIVRRFAEIHYADASEQRQADIVRQVLDSLTPNGARFDKHTQVRAGSIDRLAARCRDVIDEGVRVPDRAMRVLLLKLADTSDGSAPGVAVARADAVEQQRDEAQTAAELERAEAWLETQPDVAAAIEQQLQREFANDTSSEAMRLGRRIAFTSRLSRAWRDAGSPDPVRTA